MGNIAMMRSYVGSKYDRLYSRGGSKVPVQKAPDAQIIAVYKSLKSREAAKKMKENVSHVINRNKQYVFNF